MSDRSNRSASSNVGAFASRKVVSFALHQQKQRIAQEPLAAEHYYNLALLLQPAETVFVQSPIKKMRYTKKDLLVESLRLDPTNHYVLNNLANLLGKGEFVQLPRGPHNISYTKIELLQKALRLAPTYANAYCNLAVAMQEADLKALRVRLRGLVSIVSPRDLFELAILEDPNHALAYNNLALTFEKPNERCKLIIDGDIQQFSERQLYMRSIECDASNADPFYNLSTLLRHDNTPVTLVIDGESEVMCKKDLLIKAIALDPLYSNAYYNLANVLLDEGVNSTRVCIAGENQIYSAKMLYRKAIECNDANAMAFYNLALLLGPEEKVSLMIAGKNRLFTKHKLNVAALERAPDFPGSYINLAAQLRDPQETVSLKLNQQEMQLTKSDLLEIAAALQ